MILTNAQREVISKQIDVLRLALLTGLDREDVTEATAADEIVLDDQPFSISIVVTPWKDVKAPVKK